MKICPKTDEDLLGYDILREYIEESLEIQLLSDNLYVVGNILNAVISDKPNLKYITLHLPMRMCDISEILMNDKYLYYLHTLIYICTDVAFKTNVEVNILAHCNVPYSYIVSCNLKHKLDTLLDLFNNFKSNLLLENDVVYTYTVKSIDPAYDIVKNMNNPHLHLCLDISHMHLQTLFGNIEVDYYDIENIHKYVKQVHFSSAYSLDGIGPIEDHGHEHTQHDLISDLIELYTYKLLDKYIVTEIVGGSEEYLQRTKQIHEIKLLRGVNIHDLFGDTGM